MQYLNLVDFASSQGEKRRRCRSIGEAFQRRMGAKDSELNTVIACARLLKAGWEQKIPSQIL